MTTCPHIDVAQLQLPTTFSNIYKDECTQCFDSQDSPNGIDVCLTCFNGGCADPKKNHARLHFSKSQHPIVLNMRRIAKDPPKRRSEDESPPPPKISKLAIVPENEEDKYHYITKAKCYACDGVEIDAANPQLSKVVEAVVNAQSSAQKSEVQAWEEEVTACEHTLCLEQQPSKQLESQQLAHCSECDLRENLWLCLTCGNLGCGRRQYDGSGGNNHGLDHFENTGHGVACKLGTITPEGTADIYCYLCNDARLDPELASHLANWGISVSNQQKTEKSMTELQLEQNLKFDFSMTTEDGKQLPSLFGSGFTGLKNLGNSCYMGSVLQSIFDLQPFKDRYFADTQVHFQSCTNEPASCLDCQLHKMADGLWSGRYSEGKQEPDSDHLSQDGIAPAMLKSLVGKGHPEFSTMRQQDAHEFFQYLASAIEKKEKANKSSHDPTKIFEFELEQRLQCTTCQKVRYQRDLTKDIMLPVPEKAKSGEEGYEPVNFYECLDLFVAPEHLEYQCPSCDKKTEAIKTVKFATFPETLVMQINRFKFVNWVPTKIAVPLQIPDGPISMDKYLGTGQQDTEELLPETSTTSNEPSFDQAALDQLLAMGFPENRCKRALINTGHNGAETAMNWLFEHMEDPGIDDPISQEPASATEASAEQVELLMGMGFSQAQAKKALRETNGDPERAVDWLFSHPDEPLDEDSSAGSVEKKPAGDATLPGNFEVKSFVSHKGTSVHCGHYVAHVNKNGQWALFNDNKVAAAPKPESTSDAYMVFLQRHRQ
ncbi:ubiquitin C-terminal hydrolase Ubp14 [Umbelopsis sp. WA50703]